MTPKQLSEMRTLIQELIQTITAEIEATAHTTKPAVTPDSAIGRISRVEAMQTRHIGEASARARKERLALLKEALENMDDGEYGYCQGCEEPIPMGRLKLIPEATLCVNCAASFE